MLLRGSIALLAAATLTVLLWQLLYRGWAHSFDAMLYARGIWGLARGDTFNPIADRETLAVHAHCTSAFLAPWTWLFPATLVLIVAQAASFGAALWLLVGAFQRSTATAALPPRAATFAVLGGAALVCASPWITNPFLFDVRPDLLAVPFCVAGFLRIRERGALDARTVSYLSLAVLSREEFALPVALAALFAPLRAPHPGVWRTRLIAAAIPLGWWSFYWLIGRRILGGDAAVEGAASSTVILEAQQTNVHAWHWLALYKAELLITFVLTGGALGWRQWRWLLVATPGLVLALVNRRMQEHVLNLH